MIVRESHLGYGVYPIPVAARIVGVPPRRIRYWLDADDGLVARRYSREEETVSFLELMELMFIQMFRIEDVSLQTIRKAAETAGRRFRTNYPFAVRRFDTDGKTIFGTLLRDSDNREIVEDLKRGQYVFKQVMRPFFKNLEYGKQEAMRYWPLSKNGRIVLDPERRFGQPIDSSTGVPTKTLYEAVVAGSGQDTATVAEWFDVPQKAVEQAVAFEQSLA